MISSNTKALCLSIRVSIESVWNSGIAHLAMDEAWEMYQDRTSIAETRSLG